MQKDLQKSSQDNLNNLISAVETAIKSREKGYHDNSELNSIKKSLDATLSSLKQNQKEMYMQLSKAGKVIDKLGKIDFNTMSSDGVFDDKTKIFNSEIAMQFLREGDFELAETFIQESKTTLTEASRSNFQQLHRIISDLKKYDLTSTFEWINFHKSALSNADVDIEFLAHRQRYLQLIDQGSVVEAYQYLKKNLTSYLQGNNSSRPNSSNKPKPSLTVTNDDQDGNLNTSKDTSGSIFSYYGAARNKLDYFEQTRKLMGMLVYAKCLDSSPYKHYFTQATWDELESNIMSAFCSIFGLPQTPPLSSTVNAGTISLPIITKYLQLIQTKAKKSLGEVGVDGDQGEQPKTETENDTSIHSYGGNISGSLNSNDLQNESGTSAKKWYSNQELSTETPLPDELMFHSLFACPVSKEQSTEENPPMMMPCGHTIGKESLEKLSKNYRSAVTNSGKVKCPYCPALSSISQAKRVYF
ncbi:hypothetical protein BB560_006062 [Smittium megazygosporum]|uniref:GID complex catalytic subunit 2 n=1 Tax=Smittium megazygosporum TaxID=133381 RepID=A0A2T9YJ87_9FUNG|nr:hypothetical protein BB560_006062 [Smittium megazygosporum]